MGADRIARRYRGQGARQYELKRAGKLKWQLEHEAVAALLPPLALTVLDVPVGTGRFLELYRARGMKVTGIDTSPDMLAEAERRARGLPGPEFITLRQGDIRALQSADRSFDVAVCIRLLNWFTPAEMRAAIVELGRVASRVIVGIRFAPGAAEVNEAGTLWRHDWQDLLDALTEGDLNVEEERPLKPGADYKILRLVKCA